MRPLFRPALATDDISGYVLAYEKDPDNHIAVRGYADLDALLSENAPHTFDAPRTLSRCASALRTSPPCTTARYEFTGHHRARCATDRELRATLKDFTTWYAGPDRRPDRAPGVLGRVRRHRQPLAPPTRRTQNDFDGKSAMTPGFGR
ncbi:hypothetical protein [Streptomyces mirabilis]|uniref:hypothetical protein n=1 Tax=Streptomyces mirabilis TaxID=68239 RepID=UPI0034361749